MPSRFCSTILCSTVLTLISAAAPGGSAPGDAAVLHGPISRPGVLHITLESAIHMALHKNFSIQIEQFSPQVAQERVRGEWGRFDPVFNINATRDESTQRELFSEGQRLPFNSVSTTDRFSMGLQGVTPLGTSYDFGANLRSQTGTFNNWDEDAQADLGLGITQPLLRGFGTDVNLAQVRIARNNVLVSEWQLRQRIIDVVTQLTYVYNDHHLAKQNLIVAERSRELARQLLEDNTIRVRLGSMSPLDITSARAEFAQREEAVILARRAVRDNENFIKQIITSDMERMLSISVEAEPPPTPYFRADVLAGIDDALQFRPDYQQGLLDIRRRNIQLVVLKNQTLPRLDFTGSLNLLGFDNDLGTSISRATARDQSAWSAGAILSVPIGNRTAVANHTAAKIEAAQALLNLQRIEQQIVVDVDNATGQVVTSRERIESTREATRLARESLEAGQARLTAGASTTFEVLELQRRFSEAGFAEARARADYNRAVAEYYRQTGTTLRVNRIHLQ